MHSASEMLYYGNGQVQRLHTRHGVLIKAEKDWRGVGRPQVAMHSQLPHMLVFEKGGEPMEPAGSADSRCT